MEYRKIQKLGQNSFAISLPKKWIAQNALIPGDPLLIRESKLDLIISNPKLAGENNPQVTTFPFDENIRRNITMAYLMGAQQILVKKEDGHISAEDRRETKLILESLVGTQIVAEDASYITIDFLVDMNREDLVQRIRQLYTLVMSGFENLQSIFAQNRAPTDILNNIIARDLDVNNLYFSIVRQIRGLAKESPLLGKLKTPLYKIVDYRLMAHILENLGDCCVNIARELLRLSQSGTTKLIPQPLGESFQSYLESAIHAHQQTQTALIQTNSKIIQEVIRHAQDEIGLRMEVDQLLNTMGGRSENTSYFIVFTNLQQIYQYAIDICNLIE
ncbi:MAG: PhoU domain protein [Promethearchaeota archaeon CR_4]|nr:MAG: PhoU domain protein [Candidatus Lokiarchaeota archaeon CR_4]